MPTQINISPELRLQRKLVSIKALIAVFMIMDLSILVSYSVAKSEQLLVVRRAETNCDKVNEQLNNRRFGHLRRTFDCTRTGEDGERGGDQLVADLQDIVGPQVPVAAFGQGLMPQETDQAVK